MAELEEGEKTPKSLKELTKRLQTVQQSLNILEGIYPDLHERLEEIATRIKGHGEILHEHDSRASEYHEKGAIDANTATVIIDSMNFTLDLMDHVLKDRESIAELKAQVDTMIFELTRVRNALLAAIPKTPEH